MQRASSGAAHTIGNLNIEVDRVLANLPYFDAGSVRAGQRVEVLQNWLADAADVGCSISVAGGTMDCHGLRPRSDEGRDPSLRDASSPSLRAQRGNPGPLAGRTIFVYAGNMGVAQGMDILMDLAERSR